MTEESPPRPSQKQSAIAFAVCALAVAVIAAIGGTTMPNGWYEGLDKPGFTPPDWVSGPVWTVLYALMAVAAWLVWREFPHKNVVAPLVVFGVQLVLNALWSWLFFQWHLLGWAFAELVVLWLFILASVILFWRVRTLAGVLLLPYLAWVTYAGALNAAIWRMNM
jgi:tryptophan-rich sensory protein